MPTPNEITGDHIDHGQLVTSMQKKFRDSFSGTALRSEKWESFTNGGTLAVAGGLLTLGSLAVANAEVYVISKETFSVPFRIGVGLTLSQRIANQTFLIEAISVNPKTGLPDGLNTIAWAFDGTSATTAKYRVQSEGAGNLDSAASTVVTTAGTGFYELETFPDEAWFHSSTLDATTGRLNSYRRHQQIPDPNAVYRIRLRFLNGAVAPASNTNAAIQFVSVQDYVELTAEITAGRGQSTAGQSMAVNVTGGTVAATVSLGTVSNVDNVFWNESVTAQAISATVTGTARDAGVAVAVAHRYAQFNAFAFANQDGTLRIEASTDNVTWRTVSTVALAANDSKVLTVPVMARYHRAVYVNGATAQTAFMLNTAFTTS